MGETDAHLKKFQRELSSGTVALVLLAVLGRSNEALYGYQLAKALETGAGGVLLGKQSALYPVLRNLEASGLLSSEVQPSVSGPPRRYYRITDLGREALAEWREAWNDTRDAVDRMIEGTPIEEGAIEGEPQ